MKFPKAKDIRKYIAGHPAIVGLVDWSKRKSLPGFFLVPLYDVAIFLYRESRRNALQVRANSVAFSFMLAIFPATIVLLSLLPYLPLEGFIQEFESGMKDFVPDNMHTAMMSFIRDITDNTREGLLSLGFILALFFASNGMMALLQGFDKKYEKTVFLSRNFFSQRIVALQLVILLSTTLIASVSLIIGGNYLIDLLAKEIDAYYVTKLGLFFFRWMAVLFLFYVSIAILYRFGPAMKKKFGYITPGATLATLLCLLSSWVFSLYVNSFGTYNELYGSIGVLIVFMLWLKINAFILLAGFELNAAIAVNRDIKEDLSDDELE